MIRWPLRWSHRDSISEAVAESCYYLQTPHCCYTTAIQLLYICIQLYKIVFHCYTTVYKCYATAIQCHPIIFLRNPQNTGPWHYKPHLRSLYSKGSRIYGHGPPPPSRRRAKDPALLQHTAIWSPPPPPLVSVRHEIVARMWQFPQLLPLLAHQSWSHEYGNNGESFYQKFLWFSPRYPPPFCLPHLWFNLTSKWISESEVRLFLERILQRPGSCLWRRPLCWQVSTPVKGGATQWGTPHPLRVRGPLTPLGQQQWGSSLCSGRL